MTDWVKTIKKTTEDVNNLKYRILSYSAGLDEPGVTWWERHRISVYIYGVLGALTLFGYIIKWRWLYIVFGMPLLILVGITVISYLFNAMFPGR